MVKLSKYCVNRGRVRSYATLFCAENSQNIAIHISQYLEIFRDMAWARAYSGGFNNRAAIADQPRTNRGFHRHFLKIELIWVVRLWTLLFWFFFAIGYHYWTQCLGRPEYSILCYMPYNIDFSTSGPIVDSYTTNVCLNREPIADQSRCRVLQSRMLKYTCPFITLRFAFAIGSRIHNYIHNMLLDM